MMSYDLQAFFSPKSVAIVGVSADYHKVGHLVAKNMLLQGYMHSLYFVNPKGEHILGHDTVRSLADLPHPMDLVVFATPAEVTLSVLEQSPDLCRHSVILAAGFHEEHTESAGEHQRRLEKVLRAGRMRVLGPNCAGFINTRPGLNSTFLTGPVPVGNVGCISQSGALGSVMIDTFSAHQNLGFSLFFSLGNKSNIDECDTLEYLAHDDHTQVIAMYLEDVHDGTRFRQVLSEVTRHKPVIVMKSGSSTRGAEAAISHTGSLAGDDAIFETAIHQCGAIRARSIAEFVELIHICSLSVQPKSGQMIVVTNAGGCGVLAVDAIDRYGLQLGALHVRTTAANDTTVPNPYDLRGDADATKFAVAIAETRDEKDIGGVIVIVTPQANTQLEDTARDLIGIQTTLPHPLYPVFLGASSMETVRRILEANRMPLFDDLERLISSLGKLVEQRRRPTAHLRISNFQFPISNKIANVQLEKINPSSNSTTLSLTDAYSALQKAGIPLVPVSIVDDDPSLHIALAKISYPIVMKVSSATVTHKSDVGGVRVGIGSFAEAEGAFRQMRKLPGFEKVVIQPQISGYELIIGAKRDPVFGPVVIVGLGGVLTGLIHESVSFTLPLHFPYVEYMIGKSKLAPLLAGYRGSAPVPPGHLFEMVQIVAHLMATSDLIQEIDINPLMVTPEGGLVGVDARVVINSSHAPILICHPEPTTIL